MGIDTRERFDVIVVGGGPAGAAAAYRLAQAGVKVLLLERGQYSGAKNMMGGRIYTHSLEALIPDFRERAPLERQVMKERISIAENGHMTTVEYVQSEVPQNEESYVVLRSKFDKWLAQEAEKRGMDFAIGSGMLAADAYLAAMGEGDSSKTASHYRHMVHHSWLGKDLELYRHFPSFLGGTDRIFQVYPQFVNDIMKDVFTINDAGATPIMGKLLHRVEQVGMKELMIDALKGVRAL